MGVLYLEQAPWKAEIYYIHLTENENLYEKIIATLKNIEKKKRFQATISNI